MKWAVYWQPADDDIEIRFFKTKVEALVRIRQLTAICEDYTDERGRPNWDITLLQVAGEVRDDYIGGFQLYPV